MKRVFLLHLLANAVLLALVYVWLGMRDARVWQILLTFASGVALVSAAVYLHAGTWHWIEARNWRVPRGTLLRCGAGLVLFALAAWLLSLIPIEQIGLWVASELTFKSREAVKPEMVQGILRNLIWLVKWFVLPVLLFGQTRRARFWLLFGAVLLLCWYIPQRLVHWTPRFDNTAAELASVTLRWGAAYVLAIAGWLAILRELSRSRSAR